MNEVELIRAVLALKNFHPPEGIAYTIALQPRPGVCLIAAIFGVEGSDRPAQIYELFEPPTEPFLRALYLAAQELLDNHKSRTNRTTNILGLDLDRIGGD